MIVYKPELTRITLSDLNIPPAGQGESQVFGTLQVLAGKRRISRVVLLNAKVCQAISRYLAVRREVVGSALFLNRFNKPLSGRGVEKLIAKYLDLAGIKDASVHSLRHTFATHHLFQGTDIKTVQEVMGHSDIRTTQEYLPLALELKNRELLDHPL